MSYLTTHLSANHEKENFSCGNAALDDYFHKQAKQDVKNKVAACFVLSENQKIVKGYYTLSNGSIPRNLLPEITIKKLPRYKDLPVTLIGRLAVDQRFQGQKIGQLLLMDALNRILDAASSIGSVAAVVDPIDHSALLFYQKFDFIHLPDSGRMFLPITTIQLLFKN